MKAADFIYHKPDDVAEALRYLEDYDGEARVLAGGQSLAPMLNMRLWRPAALIDINGLSELSNIAIHSEKVCIGALVRHSEVEDSALIAERLPLLASMVRYVGDRQVRNRGTIGGSLVQGDPTGEMPLGCLVLGAEVSVTGSAGTRAIGMVDFYAGAYAARIGADEILTEIRFTKHPPHYAFREFCRRHNDFAVLSVAATGKCSDDGTWQDIRIGLGGVHETPVLAADSMTRVEGSRLSETEIVLAGDDAVNAIEPPSDVRASAEYRTHLVPRYVSQALRDLRASGEKRA